MAAVKKTVKLPSIKEEFKMEVREYVSEQLYSFRKDLQHDQETAHNYLERRVQSLENENFKRETGKLSINDWCMIVCYAAIFVGAVVMTVRALKNSKLHGHS